MKEEKIGPLIKCVHVMHKTRIDESLEKFNLTSTQMNVLIFLYKAHNDGRQVYQKDIEKYLKATNPTVSGIVKRLESKGLVVKVTNEQDARFKYIEVTEEALELDTKLKSCFNEADRHLLAGFSEDEKKQLISFLHRMIENSKQKEEF